MTLKTGDQLTDRITQYLTRIISDTNGVTVNHTLRLLLNSGDLTKEPELYRLFQDFHQMLLLYQPGQTDIQNLLKHPVAGGFYQYFRSFPLPYRDDHIHLTGSLSPEFIYSHLEKLLNGPDAALYQKKITDIYGESACPVRGPEDVRALISLGQDERFARYLKILMLAKLILTDGETYRQAAWHLAETLHSQYNVGQLRLKFTYSRVSGSGEESGPHVVSPQDILLNLWQGFEAYRRENPGFSYVLSPCFRKEPWFFDSGKYQSKKEDFDAQVRSILQLLDDHPDLEPWLSDVDTVGDERDLYSKSDFNAMRAGMRKLSYRGFHIRSHHGEVWHTLKKGVQAVDNAMNIWHIDTLEHGLSLGINPNVYYQNLFQKIMDSNSHKIPVEPDSTEGKELADFLWEDHGDIHTDLLAGVPLKTPQIKSLHKIKFHHAREVEHYQHDTLNRMIDKKVSLTALPTSNRLLTDFIPGFQDHPFSWWERKGVNLSMGTDNYVTLKTDYIREMLSLLFANPELKITKLLMVTTGEKRRPWLSSRLWKMREQIIQNPDGSLAKSIP